MTTSLIKALFFLSLLTVLGGLGRAYAQTGTPTPCAFAVTIGTGDTAVSPTPVSFPVDEYVATAYTVAPCGLNVTDCWFWAAATSAGSVELDVYQGTSQIYNAFPYVNASSGGWVDQSLGSLPVACGTTLILALHSLSPGMTLGSGSPNSCESTESIYSSGYLPAVFPQPSLLTSPSTSACYEMFLVGCGTAPTATPTPTPNSCPPLGFYSAPSTFSSFPGYQLGSVFQEINQPGQSISCQPKTITSLSFSTAITGNLASQIMQVDLLAGGSVVASIPFSSSGLNFTGLSINTGSGPNSGVTLSLAYSLNQNALGSIQTSLTGVTGNAGDGFSVITSFPLIGQTMDVAAATYTPSNTPQITGTPTGTPTDSPTPGIDPTITATFTFTPTPSVTDTPTATVFSGTVTLTSTATNTPTKTSTGTPTTDPGTATPSWTASGTPTNSVTPTSTAFYTLQVVIWDTGYPVPDIDTVVSSPAGVSCFYNGVGGGTCSATFTAGTAVTLTTYTSNSVLTGFTGCLTGLNNVLTMNQNCSVTALFGATTSTPTSTSTNTVISTSTGTASKTPTKTATVTVTNTGTETATSTPTPTVPSGTVTLTSTATNTPTWTVSNTPTHTTTSSKTPTATLTGSVPPTGTPTYTPTSTATMTATNTVLVPTPACAGATVMGSAYAPYFFTLPGATAAYVQAVAPASGAVSNLHFYSNDSGVTVILGVYSDNGGQPGALLSSSGYFTSNFEWNTVPLTTPVNVTLGANYWLAVWGFTVNGVGIGAGGPFLIQSISGLPASYAGGGTAYGGLLALIADICPGATPTPTFTFTPTPTGTWYTSTPTNTFTPTPTATGCDNVYFSLYPVGNPWSAGSTAIQDVSFGPAASCAGVSCTLNTLQLLCSTTGNLGTQIQQVQLWQGATMVANAAYSNSITFTGLSIPNSANAFNLYYVLSPTASGTLAVTVMSAFGTGSAGFYYAFSDPNNSFGAPLSVVPAGTPTSTATSTPTATPTSTITNTYTWTPSPTGTWYTSTPTNTPTNTPTGTETFTPTWTPSGITTPLFTFTPTNTSTPTSTATLPVSLTYTPTNTPGIDPTPTTDPGTFTMTPTPTPSSTATNSPTYSVDPTAFATSTATDTPTITLTFTPTTTATQAVTFTPAATPIQTVIQYVPNTLPALVILPGGVTVSMGANTLAQSTTMTIAQYPSSAAPNAGALQVLFMPYAYFINTNGFEPQTGMSVTITLPYDPAAIPAGYSVSDLTISYFDGTQWVVLPVTLDTVNHTVTVVTNHFSWWAVVMTKHTPTPVPTGLRGADHPVLYPNPANGPLVKLYLPGGSGSFDVRVQVYTPSYRKVRDLTFPNVTAGSALTLGLLDKEGVTLSNGLYYLVVTTPQGRSTLKLLVLR